MGKKPRPPESNSGSIVHPARKERREYTNEEIHVALAYVDVNGGNVYRTAIALGIPKSTLDDWVKARTERIQQGLESISDGRKEKRGDLAAKMESVLHTIVEHMPSKIPAATLSQLGVAGGILTDKIRIVRGQGLDADPAMELCRLLGINRNQIPTSLELPPGRELPPELLAQLDAINTTSSVRDAEPQNFYTLKEARSETVDSVPDTPDYALTDLAPKVQSPAEPEKPVITCANDLLPKPKRSLISTNTIAESTRNERKPA